MPDALKNLPEGLHNPDAPHGPIVEAAARIVRRGSNRPPLFSERQPGRGIRYEFAKHRARDPLYTQLAAVIAAVDAAEAAKWNGCGDATIAGVEVVADASGASSGTVNARIRYGTSHPRSGEAFHDASSFRTAQAAAASFALDVDSLIDWPAIESEMKAGEQPAPVPDNWTPRNDVRLTDPEWAAVCVVWPETFPARREHTNYYRKKITYPLREIVAIAKHSTIDPRKALAALAALKAADDAEIAAAGNRRDCDDRQLGHAPPAPAKLPGVPVAFVDGLTADERAVYYEQKNGTLHGCKREVFVRTPDGVVYGPYPYSVGPEPYPHDDLIYHAADVAARAAVESYRARKANEPAPAKPHGQTPKVPLNTWGGNEDE